MIDQGDIRETIRSAFLGTFGGLDLTSNEAAFVTRATTRVMRIINDDAPCVACAERDADDDDEPDKYTVKTTVYKNGTQIAASSVVIDPK